MKRIAIALMFSAGLIAACASQPKIEDPIPMAGADPNAPPPLILHPSEAPALYASDKALAVDVERTEMAGDAGVPPRMDGGTPRLAGDGGVPKAPQPTPNPNPNNPTPNPTPRPTPAPSPPHPSTPSHP